MITPQKISEISIPDIEKLFQRISELNAELFALGIENAALRNLLEFQKMLADLIQ